MRRRTGERPPRGAAWLAAIALLAGGPLHAGFQTETGNRDEQPAEESAATPAAPSSRTLLDSIREDLVQLRFEKALAAIDALLGEPSLSEADRVEALVLRAQAHAAFGDFDATEEDYRQILRRRPGYVPEATLIPDKAMQRFRKVRAELVGVARLTLAPPDARLTVDGREVVAGPDGALPLLGGKRVLRAEARGHDPEERVLEIAPGSEVPVELRLLPNSRDVVLRTRPAGVTVTLDGVVVGTTRRGADAVELGLEAPPGELRLESVALGQHVFQFHRECYRSERRQDMLTVDLLDRAPKVYETVVLQPARATVTVTGGPAGAELHGPGGVIGVLPLPAPLDLCPGDVVLEARAAGRTLWREERVLEEDRETRLEVRPRPNAVIVGAEAWPAELGELGRSFNTLARLKAPRVGDLSSPDGWSQVALPPGTDLALAVLPPAREGGRDRWMLYSPRLQAVEPIEVAPAGTERPQWARPVWGLRVADSRVGGGAFVVDTVAGGPAARAGVLAGERIRAVAGRPVAGLADVRSVVRSLPEMQAVTLTLAGAGDETREVTLTPASSPVLLRPDERRLPPPILAAWAEADAAAFPERAPAALSNLALLLSERGAHALAAETWRRVRWGERAGIGEGTTAYHLGRDLLALGREAEAIEAFRRAAAGRATAWNDDGPEVAPAARDHLADLGVTLSP